MNLSDIVLNYLTVNEKGMQQLITWFLNDVMNEEVAHEAETRYIAGMTGKSSRPE
jgi:hypothetical protein